MALDKQSIIITVASTFVGAAASAIVLMAVFDTKLDVQSKNIESLTAQLERTEESIEKSTNKVEAKITKTSEKFEQNFKEFTQQTNVKIDHIRKATNTLNLEVTRLREGGKLAPQKLEVVETKTESIIPLESLKKNPVLKVESFNPHSNLKTEVALAGVGKEDEGEDSYACNPSSAVSLLGVIGSVVSGCRPENSERQDDLEEPKSYRVVHAVAAMASKGSNASDEYIDAVCDAIDMDDADTLKNILEVPSPSETPKCYGLPFFNYALSEKKVKAAKVIIKVFPAEVLLKTAPLYIDNTDLQRQMATKIESKNESH